jgi:hypothetical protein
MSKNKYEFIKELLESRKIGPIQRERILELAAKEVHSDGSLEERVQEIEKIVFIDIPVTVSDHINIENGQEAENNEEKEKNDTESLSLPNYVYPSSLYKFLFFFNQNNVLKSTCHDIDSNEILVINKYCETEKYDFKQHLKKIIEEYEIHDKKYFAPYRVKGLIRGYLTGKDFYGKDLKKGWSAEKIKHNWSHPELISWAEKNPNYPPNPNEGLIEQNENVGYEFDRIVSKVSGSTIQNFRELVIHFKHLFHLRNDNSLHEIIIRTNTNENWNETVDFDINDNFFPKNIEHFTDVGQLVQAYKKLIELIIEQHNDQTNKPKVKLTFSEHENAVYFSIHHINNTYNKTIQNIIDKGIGQAYSGIIKLQINGMCNLYLKADFGQGNYAQINLWDGKERKAQEINQFKGVEHILEFPKK